MKSRLLRHLRYLFDLHRFPLSLSRMLLTCYAKKLFRIEVNAEEKAIYELLLGVMAMHGRCIREDAHELTFAFSPGDGIILRKYPSSDLNVFLQVCQNKHYQPVVDLMKKALSTQDPLNIIDAGGNIGCSGIFFKRAFPKAHVIILEPEPSNFSLLERNIHLNGCRETVGLKAGLWKNEAYLEVKNDFRDKREWSYYTREVSSPSQLKGIGVLDLVERYGWRHIDLLKVDIEGGERYLFEDEEQAGRFLAKTKFIAIEIHDEFDTRERINNCLTISGFECFISGELTIGRNKNLAL